MAPVTRVLCLGNDLLADDAFGIEVAELIRTQVPTVEVVEASVGGFHLLDYLQDVSRLVVVDSIQTGRSAPGTIYVLREDDVVSVPGGSPHYIGLFETLSLARTLQQPVPEEVIILAVEVADCTSMGAPLHPAVKAAVPVAARLVRGIVEAPAGCDFATKPVRPEMACLRA
jgi:hydrogenase maturation protease